MAISKSQKGLELRRLLALLLEMEAVTEANLLAAYRERWPDAATITLRRLRGMLDRFDRRDWIDAWRTRHEGDCPTCGKAILRQIPRDEWEWEPGHMKDEQIDEVFELLRLKDTLD